jgi:hypothetical protein
MMRTILAICLLGLSSVAAAAEEEFVPDWYTGFGVGRTTLDGQLGGFDFKASDTAYQFILGYRITPHVSIEGAYAHAGKGRDTIQGIPVTIEATAFHGAIVGTVPVSETFGLHARVGAMKWDADGNVGGIRVDDDGTDLVFGGGASLRIKDSLFRLDWQRADIEDLDADQVLLSLMILI